MSHNSGASHERKAKRSLQDLPSPRELPGLGNLHQLDPKRLHTQLENWAQSLGPHFTIRIGSKRIFVTSDLNIALTVFRERPGKFRRLSAIERATAEMGINGVFSIEGDAWRPQRNLVMQALAPHRLESFFPTLQRITERLCRRWQGRAAAGVETDALDDLTRFTVDTTATLVFGQDINTLESDKDAIQHHLGVIFPMLSYRVNALFPYWRYVKLPRDYELDRSLRAVRSFAAGMIDRTRRQMHDSPAAIPRNLLEAMLALRDEPNSGFSDDDVHANIITLLLAGEDTTAHSLAWTMHHLAHDPALQLQLQRAADGILGQARLPATFAATAALGLFEGVAFEAMRMRPVAPMNYFEANEDVELQGISIPKGTPLFLLTRPASLDDGNFFDAKDFKPGRWTVPRQNPGEAHNTKAFIQFGAGPRFCPGRYLATLEIKMVLAMLSRNFAIEHAEHPDCSEEVFAFTMMPSRLRLRIKNRNNGFP